ncbi:MAG: hypothetical protein V1837_03415 [Candidatus Woesearchaeota archaeon]
MEQQNLMTHINVAIQTPEPEDLVKKFKTLAERICPEEQEELFRLVTGSYLLAVKDCTEHLHYYTGPVGMWGLKKLWDNVKPGHNIVFY